ncbi:hypothetical protein [Blautia sp. 1033sp1_1033st1_G9_1033SCRN_220408]|uniref:hypothetical protein n=1 Tax=Blautia sp. 1033sp1_1033st1_G9_1033SCRN_220408 TaxID=3144490 RepID=UPI0034A17ACF
MATSFEPIKFANLTEKTTAPSDADIIVIEDSTATKKAKWSNLISWIKSKLNIGSADISGIGDGTITGAVSTLNTKIDLKGTYRANVPAVVAGNFVGFLFITIPNADSYSIEITDVTVFGGTDKASFAWTIAKSKLGINVQINNSDAAYFFGTAHPNRLWTLTIKIS